jgi:uncharacterized protein (TIGR00269 family)
MECRKCGGRASINMRQHKLPLCRDHFIEWIPAQTQRAIESYNMFQFQDRVLVAVSGGKDSLALWDVLTGLGYRADGLYIDLGIESSEYSKQSRARTETFASSNGLTLITVRAADELGVGVPAAAALTRRGRGKSCSVCGLTKRYVMNQVALKNGYDILVTGHNLDDEAATLFGNTLNWQVGYLQRQWPALEARPGFVRKAKPFYRLYERETAAYAFLRSIDYIYQECPYAIGAKSIYHKDILNRMERDRPGAKLSFYLSFLRAKAWMRFAEAQARLEFSACPVCGAPTSADGLCSFCRLKERVHERIGVSERTHSYD